MYQVAVQVLNPDGTVALVAAPNGATSLSKGRKTLSIIQGDAVPQIFIPKLIALHQTREFPFDRLVKSYEFSEINRAMAYARRGDSIKPVLRISKA
jgi:aryl-alcohol dehydrogenase